MCYPTTPTRGTPSTKCQPWSMCSGRHTCCMTWGRRTSCTAGCAAMLIFAGMLGKQAQRCIPYLKDYFQFTRPGVPAGPQPPRPPPCVPRASQPATLADNADVDEDGYSSSAGSANSDINHNNIISDASDEDEDQANQRSAVVGGRPDGGSTAPPQPSPPGGTDGRNNPPPALVPMHVRGTLRSFQQAVGRGNTKKRPTAQSSRGRGGGGRSRRRR